VVAAIGTAGAAPMLAALLRADLEARIPEGLGAVADLLGRYRGELRAAFPDLPARRAFLRTVLDGPIPDLAMSDPAAAGERFRAEIDKGAAVAGKVWLIAAPADRDLLSLRAARALAMADVLVVGDGVGRDITALARRDAAWRTLAETDPAFLSEFAVKGQQAVVVASARALEPIHERMFTLAAPAELLIPAAER
jgi:precorrin-2 dehydrogenase/sirohydrochlorin ferrochelatase